LQQPGETHIVKRVLASVSFIALIITAPIATATGFDTARVQAFSEKMQADHGFNASRVAAALGQAKFRQSIIDAITRPAEAKPWYQYRPIFLTGKRIRAGVAFWRAHAGELDAAREKYGVDPAIIVAIIGVESFYGTRAGSYPVIDSLATLAFGYPPRSDFFTSELEQFFLLTREQGLDPLQPTGSYAGAMGAPQFIASSYRHYAVDFDGDGKADIWNDWADIIGSVANYFHAHGWQAGAPVAVPAALRKGHAEPVADGDLTTADALRQEGLFFSEGIPGDSKAMLVSLDNGAGDDPDYWVGLENFWCITRYNHSPLYAMAAWQLSDEIRRRHDDAADSP
jgi:membrane-bound lytic murein transglycosylase B